jgi:hypothetical protein
MEDTKRKELLKIRPLIQGVSISLDERDTLRSICGIEMERITPILTADDIQDRFVVLGPAVVSPGVAVFAPWQSLSIHHAFDGVAIRRRRLLQLSG